MDELNYYELSLKTFAKCLVDEMSNTHVNLNFNAFLEKTKLKDDGSNYSDWVQNLRIILIAAKKDYVLEAPLGARPAAGATPDVMSVGHLIYKTFCKDF